MTVFLLALTQVLKLESYSIILKWNEKDQPLTVPIWLRSSPAVPP